MGSEKTAIGGGGIAQWLRHLLINRKVVSATTHKYSTVGSPAFKWKRLTVHVYYRKAVLKSAIERATFTRIVREETEKKWNRIW